MDFFPLDVFFAILITVGPLKVLLVYGEMTRDLAPELRRGIAIKAVGVAAIVGFGLRCGRLICQKSDRRVLCLRFSMANEI
jgi:small neutral amino acid transporter SnatA (MarC family)